eukprot:TRINITY_DN5337_c0_g1_i3.p1 TRINITY_DN5337_c0_g1~~TRINITY_DN5337_c0_g1_i3.p1  ORF type:complete len:260 (-),score=43.81 TRINITY_DN5337_c0_g1_i3:30-809(-)
MASASYQPVDDAPPTRSRSSELRRTFSSHWHVPKDHVNEEQVQLEVRLHFRRKVYGILSAQMVLTISIASCFMFYKPLLNFATHNLTGRMVQFAIFVPTVCVLCCMSANKNEVPANYVLLSIFTVLISIDIGIVCALFMKAGLGMDIFQAFAITGFVFLSLTAFVSCSKRDFSWMGGFLFVGLNGLIFVGFLGFFFPGLTSSLFYSYAGAIIFSGYIIYDTWRIEKVFGPDDYIIAAIELYLDIINLFLYILQILGRSD